MCTHMNIRMHIHTHTHTHTHTHSHVCTSTSNGINHNRTVQSTVMVSEVTHLDEVRVHPVGEGLLLDSFRLACNGLHTHAHEV